VLGGSPQPTYVIKFSNGTSKNGWYKQVNCKGGGRRNTRKTKRALRNRRRYSRKN
jgi:hypothetical protein